MATNPLSTIGGPGGDTGTNPLSSIGAPKTTYGGTGTDSVDGLLALAQQQGGAVAEAANELVHPRTGILSTIGSGLKNAFSTFVDIISIPSETIAGIISPKYTVGEAIEKDIRVSDVLFGDRPENQSTMQKIGSFFTRTAVDIMTDPLTFVTFGAGQGLMGLRALPKIQLYEKAAAQVGKGAMESAALSKEGADVFKFLKNVEYQAKGMAVAKKFEAGTKLVDGVNPFEIAGKELDDLLKVSIDAPLNKDYAKIAMSNMLEKFPQLAETLIDKGGIKLFGKTIVSGQRVSAALKLIPGMTLVDDLTRPMRNSVSALFDPSMIHTSSGWQRLPEEYVDLETAARDLSESMKGTGVKNLVDIVRANKLTVDEAKMLAAAVEARKIPADARLANAYKQFLGYTEEQYQFLTKSGITLAHRDNHVPHILLKEDMPAEKSMGVLFPPKQKVEAAFTRKVGETIDEARANGFTMDENIVTAHLQRTFDNIESGTAARFMREAAQVMGRPASEAGPGWRKISVSGITKEAEKILGAMGVNRAGEELVFHPAVATRIEKFMGSVINDEASQNFLKAFDKVQSLWKASVTSVFPAFHGRNAISNVFLNMMDLGVHSINPVNHATSIQMITMDRQANRLATLAAGIGEVADKAKDDLVDLISKPMFTDATGHTWSFGELRTVIRNRGIAFTKGVTGSVDVAVTHEEQVAALFPEYLKGSSKAKQLAGKVLPVGQEFVPFKVGREVGRAVEEQARILNFVANLRNTGDVTMAANRTKQFLFDYSNLTAFEKTFLRRLVPFYTFCLPDSSEILTRDGWKTCDDLIEGEEVLTYNVDKNHYEWQRADEIHIFDYDNELTSLSNSRHELLFTPDHRWVVETSERDVKRPYGTYHYELTRKVVRGYELNTNHNIKVVSELPDSNEKSLLTPDQAKLLGWLLTDGYWRWRGNYCEAVIYQTPKKWTYRYAVAAAGGKEPTWFHENGTARIPVRKELTEALHKYLKRSKTKDTWIDVVTRLSKEAAQAMYDAMYMGDGTTTPNRTQDSFACQLHGVGETFQVLATLLGKRCVKNSKGYYVSRAQTLKVSGTNMKSTDYVGRVWCPVTQNGTWVTRQGKLVTITGNTRKNLELQVKSLLTTPGRVAAEITALTTLGDTIAGGELTEEQKKALPDWIKTGINLLRSKDGNAVEIYGSLGTPVESPFQQLQPNVLLGSISPLLRLPIEQMTGYSFFQGKPLSEVTNATAFKNAPQALKDFIGYTEVAYQNKKTGKKGTVYISLRPERMNLILNLPPTTRVFSAMKQMDAADVSTQSKILQQIVGVRPYSFDLEQEAAKREAELKKQLEDLLTSARVTSQFTRTYVPK